MIGQTFFNELIDSQDLIALEKHLVYSYVKSHNLEISDSKILTEYFNEFEIDVNIYLSFSSIQINTIKDLENHLELIIPKKDRKVNGAFFTPNYIVDFIINEVKPQLMDKNLDPSCGCGAFLIGLAEYYKYTFKKSIKATVKENIYGADILSYNILRSKVLITIYALQNGEILEDSDFNLFCQDSLRTTWSLNFDNIVGNPPYVKFQDLSDDNRKYLFNQWSTATSGTFNLYFAFFELGYKLLKPKGRLGFITPNNYFTSMSGEAIRKFFHQKKCVTRIIDFSHKKVFNAQTYTALTFLSKDENEFIKYDRIKEEYNPEDFLPIANGSPNYLNDLNFKKWRLLKSDEQKNIKNIENIGVPIGKLFDISVGVATLKDEIYLVDERHTKDDYYLKHTQHGTFYIEKEVTKKLYKVSDFKTQEEIDFNWRKIICPYNFENGKATPIKESDFKIRFPKCYEYFLSEKETLSKRDKGKMQLKPFYVWGRTQGLLKHGLKILNPTFSKTPRFLLVEEESFFTNGYGIYSKRIIHDNELFLNEVHSLRKKENVDILQKILNSCIMDYYIKKTSVSIEGGYPCYQKNFIEKFSIPNLEKDDIAFLRSLNSQNDIDEFLIDKYQLKILRPKRLS